MQVLELLFYLTITTFLFKHFAKSELTRNLSFASIAGSGLLILFLHLIFEGPRWQLIPAYSVFSMLLLLCLKKKRSHIVLRITGVGTLGFFTLLSAFLSHQLPVLKLPEPTGPFAVGTFSYSVVDESRLETYDPEGKAERELFVEVWYPASKSGDLNSYPVRSLWQELYAEPLDIVGFFTAYMKYINTHSHFGIPIAQREAPYPVLIFNHGFLSWTSQNTLLMEHMASHGYIVFSIAHPYLSLKVNLDRAGTIDMVPPRFSAEMAKSFNRITLELMALPRSRRTPAFVAYMNILDDMLQLPAAEDRLEWIERLVDQDEIHWMIEQETARTVLYFLQGMEFHRERTATWTQDTAFIVNQLDHVKAPIAAFSESLDASRLGVLGHSYGGSTALNFCKLDLRCNAGVNMDGQFLGSHWQEPMQVPFLMMYGDYFAQGHSDFALAQSKDYHEYTIDQSRHSDFSDIAYVIPLLKTLQIDSHLLVGEISADRMYKAMNATILNFFDHYLKEKQ